MVPVSWGEGVKSWKISLKLITVDVTVKTNVLGFRDNNFFSDIQLYISDDQDYDKLSGKKDL
jgi:hypothetical protein